MEEDSPAKLVVCISSTALFNCTESHEIWKKQGLDAYKHYQRDQINVPLRFGVGYRLIESLLKLNKIVNKPLIDVVLVSRNDAATGQRIMNSIEQCNLDITCMSFTSGTDVTNYLSAWKCDLFLSTEEEQVKKVLASATSDRSDGIAAGLVYDPTPEAIPTQPDLNNSPISYISSSSSSSSWPQDQVRIVFDGDGVLFSNTQTTNSSDSDSEDKHEPFPRGPLQVFAMKLQKVRQALGQTDDWRLRTFLTLSRNNRNTKRLLNTLKQWGLEIDEVHILDGRNMTPFLHAIDPAIIFNNSMEYIQQARTLVPAAHVPFDSPIFPIDIDEVLLSRPQSFTENHTTDTDDNE